METTFHCIIFSAMFSGNKGVRNATIVRAIFSNFTVKRQIIKTMKNELKLQFFAELPFTLTEQKSV